MQYVPGGRTLNRMRNDLGLDTSEIGAADDRVPEYMCEEPLPPHNTVFDVPAGEMDGIFADL